MRLPPSPRFTLTRLRPLAWGLAGCALIGGAAWLADCTAQRLLRQEAEHTALHYARFIAGASPGLAALFERRELRADTRAELHRLRHMGDVFRFLLFDRRGQLLLASDALEAPVPAPGSPGVWLDSEHEHAPIAERVLGGHNVIEVKSGHGQAGHPALYSEAYVPVMAGDRVLGVIEVYVDQTTHAGQVRNAFAEVAAIVALLVVVLGLALLALARRQAAERRQAQSRLRYLSEHDVLSGALNRASFMRALDQAAKRRPGTDTGFAVLRLDLDRFKDINDALGHSAGDEVLRQTAIRLGTLVRQGDLVARLGGDEFAILQNAVKQPEDTSRLAQRVVTALGQPFEVAGQLVACGTSVGVARFGSDAQHIHDLLHKADVAMQRAKQQGRGRFSCYDAALDHEIEARRTLVHDLRQALAQGEISLHYQPLWQADGRGLAGYEALMRWQHPLRGAVPPTEFIALAEQTGQIEALGTWALHQACAQAARWPTLLRVAVNLSAAQFHGRQDLVEVVRQALQATGLPASRLELEITESLLMHSSEQVQRTLRALSAMGVHIAMDDFGTGYSSLAYLWRFPFDKIKIDRAFTSGLVEDAKAALIVRAIVSLAHAMGIRVNAEGVETEPQRALLQALGCDELQGFLMGRPVPAERLSHNRPPALEISAAAAEPQARSSVQ